MDSEGQKSNTGKIGARQAKGCIREGVNVTRAASLVDAHRLPTMELAVTDNDCAA